jgi:hypothetical protein
MPEPSWSYRPLQSLIRQRGSRCAGFPTPGTVLVLAEHPTHPVFPALPMPKEATPWAILSWGSALLHGLSQSPRPQPLGWGHLSWGSLPLQRIRWRESTSLAVARSSHPGAPGLAASSHAAGFGAAHRFSQPPSGFLFPPPSCHFQTGGAPGVLPFRGFSSSLAALATRRRQHALLTFFLQVAHPPFLGGGTSRHDNRYLGSSGRRLWSSSGPWSARESVRTIKPRLMSRWSTCPSWASPPHGSAPATGGEGFRPTTVALHESRVRRRIFVPLRSTACHQWRRALSHERTLPSRGFSPSTSSQVSRPPALAYSACRLFAFARHTPRGAADTWGAILK